MKRNDDMELRLREIPVDEPPAELLERIIDEIPDELPAGGGSAGHGGKQWWMAAAAVLVLVLTGVVTWKMGPVGPTVSETPVVVPVGKAAGAEQAPAPAEGKRGARVGRVLPELPAAPVTQRGVMPVEGHGDRTNGAGAKTDLNAPPSREWLARTTREGSPAERPGEGRSRVPAPVSKPIAAPTAGSAGGGGKPTSSRPTVQRAAASKAGSLTFSVSDEGNRPLPGAAVTLSAPDMSVSRSGVTDAEGKVEMTQLPPGEYRAKVSLPGYQIREYDKLSVGRKKERVAVTLGSAFMSEQLVTASAPVVDMTRRSGRTNAAGGSSQLRGTTLKSSNIRNALREKAGFRRKLQELSERAKQLKAEGRVREGEALSRQLVDLRRALERTAPPSTGGTTEPNDQPYGDVFFDPTGVNPFVDTEDDRLSTFGLDVDTGSYTITRRYLHDGHLPPPAAIRVEEFVNAFDYGDPAPRRKAFRLTAEGAPNPFGGRERSYLLRFAVHARDVDAADRPPALLIFTVDVSGSMARENRLGLVKRALEALLDELRPDDTLGLVVYGSRGRVLLEPTRDHEAIRRAVERLQPGGSTNAEEGLVLAYRMADRYRRAFGDEEGPARPIVRVILCSDGVANVGRTGARSIFERIRREADKGIELTTVGFGMGNYNDTLMERLADTGDGRYAYVDEFEEAHRIFVEELAGTLMTLAHEARSQVEFNPEVVERWRLLGYENRDIADERFRDPTVDAGEVGAGQTVTALYEVKLARRVPLHRTVATLRLRYRPAGQERFVEVERRLSARELARSWQDASPRLRLAAAAAEFAEILKHSYWAKHDSLEDVLRELRRLHGPLAGDPRVQELEELVRKATALQRHQRRRE